MKNSNEPALPCTKATGEVFDGLTKREHFAGLAMQGLITGMGDSDWEYFRETGLNASESAAKLATSFADALLKQLEQSDEG